MTSKLDTTDLKILKLLQENGKITNLELSRQIDLSPASTLERVKKLEESAVISGFYAKVNPLSVGIGYRGFLLVSLNSHIEEARQEFLDGVSKINGVIECHRITGKFDYLLKVVASDIANYEHNVLNELGKIGNIGSLESIVILASPIESRGLAVPLTNKP